MSVQFLTPVGPIELTLVGPMALTWVGPIELALVGPMALTWVGPIELTLVGPILLTLVGPATLCDRARAVTRAALLTFLRQHRYVVQTSVSASGVPQAAVVGVAVADDFTLIFDTLESTRKAANIRHNPNVAFVIGGWTPGDERSVQYEGVADLPHSAALEHVREQYFAVFPDGRDRLAWKGIMHVRVRPTWLRYSDYTKNPPEIVELDASALQALT